MSSLIFVAGAIVAGLVLRREAWRHSRPNIGSLRRPTLASMKNLGARSVGYGYLAVKGTVTPINIATKPAGTRSRSLQDFRGHRAFTPDGTTAYVAIPEGPQTRHTAVSGIFVEERWPSIVNGRHA